MTSISFAIIMALLISQIFNNKKVDTALNNLKQEAPIQYVEVISKSIDRNFCTSMTGAHIVNKHPNKRIQAFYIRKMIGGDGSGTLMVQYINPKGSEFIGCYSDSFGRRYSFTITDANFQ